MRDIDRLRAACAQRVRDIAVPRPFEISLFRRNVAAHRSRPIRVIRIPGLTREQGFPYGLWVAYDEHDEIYVERETSGLHRAQIVLHELAHMLCEHDPDEVMDAAVVRQVVPHLPGDGAISHMFARHNYSRYQEQEAEMTGSLLLERAGVPARRGADDADGLLDRLGEALAHPLRDERRDA